MLEIVTVTYKCESCGKTFKKSKDLVKKHEELCYKTQDIMNKWKNNNLTLKELFNYYNSHPNDSKNKEEIDYLTSHHNLNLYLDDLIDNIRNIECDSYTNGTVNEKIKSLVIRFLKNLSIDTNFKCSKDTNTSEVILKMNKIYMVFDNFLNIIEGKDPYEITDAENIINIEWLKAELDKKKVQKFNIRFLNKELASSISFNRRILFKSKKLKNLCYLNFDDFKIIKNDNHIDLIYELKDDCARVLENKIIFRFC